MLSHVSVRSRVTAVRPEVWTAAGCTVFLLTYGNLTSSFSADARAGFLLWSNLGLMALLLVWSLVFARFSLQETGLARTNILPGAAIGATIAVIVAIPPVAFVALAPLFNGSAVDAPELTNRSGASLAYYLLLRQPIGTALFEEVAFRGVLYAAWLRVGGDKTAVLATALAFAAWHLVITSRTVPESGIVTAPATVALGVLVSLAGLFVGGLIFAYLRWRTGSIVAAAVAHWLIVAFMSVTVWAAG